MANYSLERLAGESTTKDRDGMMSDDYKDSHGLLAGESRHDLGQSRDAGVGLREGNASSGEVRFNESKQNNVSQKSRRWRDPLSLLDPRATRFCLAGLVVFFIVVLAALESLNYSSGRNQGLSSPDAHIYYLWTYGPTFVLTLAASIWSQIEYRIREAAPWAELKKGARPPHFNLLLNYITPLSPKSFYTSLKLGHYQVTLAIFGGFVIKILIIFSTGLLALEPQLVITTMDIKLVDEFTFDLESFYNSSKAYGAPATVWAVTQHNVSAPPGTSMKLATQSFFNPDNATVFDVISANVDVFEPSLDCKSFNWQWPTTTTPGNETGLASERLPKADFDEFSPYCVSMGDTAFDIQFLASGRPLVNASSWVNTTLLVDNCPLEGPVKHPHPGSTHRIFKTVAFEFPNKTTTTWALLCRPIYNVTQREVTLRSNSQTAGELLDVAPKILASRDIGLSPSNITENVFDNVALSVDDIWATIMQLTTSNLNFMAFENTTLYAETFQGAFQALTTQVVKETQTRSPQDTRLSGIAMRRENRLVITPHSLRTMEGLVILLVLLAVALFALNREKKPFPGSSMMQMADTLSKATELHYLLAAQPSKSTEELERRLSPVGFSSTPDFSKITVHHYPGMDRYGMAPKLDTVVSPACSWWRPTAMEPVYRFVIVILTIGLLVALEVLHQKSWRSNGLNDVSPEGYAKYAWTFVPTAVMAGVGLAYGAIDSAYRTLHPFFELRKQKADNRDAMTFDPLSKLAPLGLVHALPKKYFGLSATLSIAILTPMLTIAASGLYSTTPILSGPTASVGLDTWFNLRSAYKDFDPSAWVANGKKLLDPVAQDALFGQGVLFNNLSYPSGSYEEFAFPTLNSADLAASQLPKGVGSLKLRLPAARGQMGCTAVELNGAGFVDGCKRTEDECTDEDGKVDDACLEQPNCSYIPIPTPAGCTPGPESSANGSSLYLLRTRMGGVESDPGYFGFLAYVQWAEPAIWFVSQPGLQAAGDANTDIRDAYTLCGDSAQHLFLVYGHRVVSNTTDHLTVLHCQPYVEAVQVDATFSLPTLVVDSSAPVPKVVPSSNRTWGAANASENSVPFSYQSYPFLTTEPSFDPFFSALTLGRDGTPPDELLVSQNRVATIEKVNKLYQRLVSLSLHMQYRCPLAEIRKLDTGDPDGTSQMVSQPVTAEVIDSSSTRLAQSAVSTRLLEGLLLLIVVLALMSFWLAGRTRVVPLDPGTLAARMSLLVDSELVASLASGRLVGETFALGWWERQGGRSYGVDVLGPGSG
ncbi:hypothetical protein GQ53DRAFT_826905 [Thozetella sp. PMI_491]|nr:hypothetical protein GQ53DRAFT_826905 [Thozetella sp. PMI_491]